MDESREKFLDRLRSLSEPMKRRVLVAGTVVVMLAVVYIWVGYFNSIVMSGSGELASQSAVAQGNTIAVQPAPATGVAANAATPGFWSQLGGGFVSLYHDAVAGLENLGGTLQKPQKYTVTPQQ